MKVRARTTTKPMARAFGRAPSVLRVPSAARILAPVLAASILLLTPLSAMSQTAERPRARDLGVEPGIFPTGELNTITDVPGVRVGQVTVWEGDSVRTGVTAVVPHEGNLFLEKVPAAIHVGNGFGKLLGVTQVRELGEIETPILLTCTLCVWRAADAMVGWMLEREGMADVRSINPVVGETNDSGLNDIRQRPIRPEHVREALETATGGPVDEGSVGAGTGTRAFGWKGGIGTSSRAIPDEVGGYTVGVLVQTNFGGVLTIDGAPVGEELGRYPYRGVLERAGHRPGGGGEGGTDAAGGEAGAWEQDDLARGPDPDQGSVMIVVATDAPLSSRNLERLAARAIMGLARTGSYASNGSGDYVIAFSTAEGVRRRPGETVREIPDLDNNRTSPLFLAAIEATEEAIYNSLFRATTVTGHGGTTAEALPIDRTVEILRRYGVIRR